jgi:type VI secretion system protein VasD
VHLRIYQLTDRQAFLRASFQELANADGATLAGTLLRRDTYDLCPREMGREPLGGGAFCQGDTLQIAFELQPAARYVGVIAEFSDLLDPAGNWRSIAEVTAQPSTEPTTVPFTITLQRATVSARFD